MKLGGFDIQIDADHINRSSAQLCYLIKQKKEQPKWVALTNERVTESVTVGYLSKGVSADFRLKGDQRYVHRRPYRSVDQHNLGECHRQ